MLIFKVQGCSMAVIQALQPLPWEKKKKKVEWSKMQSQSRLHQWKPISHEYHLKQGKKVPGRDKKPQKLMAHYNVKSCLQGSLCRLRVHPSVCWGLCVESVPAFAYFACYLLVTGVEVENITKSRNYSDYQGHREGEKVNGQGTLEKEIKDTKN